MEKRELKKILRYDKKTGIFTWRKDRNYKIKKGSAAGYLDKDGYTIIGMNSKPYKAHRLVFLYLYGRFPDGDIDHLNRIKTDNRISNLRIATKSENQRNRRMSRNNMSGFTGVCWYKKANRWLVQISVNGKDKYLGLFTNKSEAIKARKEANIKYNFHKNHGLVDNNFNND